MEKMRCLIMSNMYPSKDMPYSGIFVKNQYLKVKELLGDKDTIELKCLKSTQTGKLGSIIKYVVFFLKIIPLFFKKYDVIHLHYFFPLGAFPYLYKKIHPKCKVVVTAHGSDIYNFMNNKIIAFFYKPIAKAADVFIAVGNDLADEINKTLDLKPDLILSAGVDQETFFQEVNCEKKYDFLFTGSFIKRKGVDLVCDTIRSMKNNLSYCFVGGGPLEPEILSLKNEGYNIVIKKNQTQNELRKIYNQSKWFLFPSRNEPFGLVVTEAIFCGTPVLVSRVGGIKEQVQDGYNGYFLKSAEIDSVKRGIDKVLYLDKQQYNEMVENCLVSNKEYSLIGICEQLLNLYRQ